jgi:hypothetical protein
MRLQGSYLRDNRLVIPAAGTRIGLGDGVYTDPVLAIDAVPEKFKISVATYFRILNILYLEAITTGLAFSAADTINVGTAAGLHFGIWLVQITTAKVVSTKSPAADQVYATAALALAALPNPDAGKVGIGYILVGAKAAAAWTATVDDLVAASDCDSIVFAAYPWQRTGPTDGLLGFPALSGGSDWDWRAVTIQSHDGNSLLVVVGGATVTASAATRRGTALRPGEAMELVINSPLGAYLDSQASGNVVVITVAHA